MPLEEIDLHLNQNELPADVNDFLVEADRRIDELFDSERNRKVPRFIPSNAELLYNHLSAIISEDICLGNNYCEWGSGYGVGTCLASILGFKSFGIDSEGTIREAILPRKTFNLGGVVNNPSRGLLIAMQRTFGVNGYIKDHKVINPPIECPMIAIGF